MEDRINLILTELHQYFPHLVTVLLLFWILYKAHTDTASTFRIYDYFIDPVTNKASITKTLQMIAGLSGTWIVCKMEVDKTLTVDFFGVYLAAMGLSEAYTKFVGAKYGSKSDDK